MAAELLGGAALQAVFGVLLDRLTPRSELLNFFQGKKLNQNLLHRLKPTLIAARAVVNDAELRQFEDHVVKEWLADLKDAVYEVEDLMDEISPKGTTHNQVCHFSAVSLNKHDADMANKLESITDRLECIVRQKDIIGLKMIASENLSWRPQSTSLAKVSGIFGREKEKEDVMKLMVDDDDNLSVIPIVGMGGVGKTTLVQLVYNDDYVKQKFDLRAWVCVSETFDLLKITQTIIKAIAPNFSCDGMDLNLLQLNLEERLAGKKFLIVLDDVWNHEYTDWDTLMSPFHSGVRGSKIVVTTRNERIASMVKTIHSSYHLNLLSDEDCLSLFAGHAFHSRDPTANSYLKKFGSDIASKCKGLPLAAKVLGGLFRSRPDTKSWDAILKDNIWDSAKNKIIPVLSVSYYYLPPHLKQCFLYCSLFPQDYKFCKEDLILMWMAEGFLQPSNREMTLEEVGYEYFDELTSRSFFQLSTEVYEPWWPVVVSHRYVMHDLIHELATCIAGDFFFRLENQLNKISNRTRHVSWCHLSWPHLSWFHWSRNSFTCSRLGHLESLDQAKHLRTFIRFETCRKFNEGALHIPLPNFKYLRTLSLCCHYNLMIVLDSIGELIHLRYLDLSNTEIVSLPDSLCKLSNLQTLRLYECRSLETLPDDMQDLVNLRHLDIRSTSLKGMPRGVVKLKNLQFLSDFIVDKETMIGELGEMSNLKERLEIQKLENIKNGNEAYEARIMEKKHIKTLIFSWSNDDNMKDSETERDIMDRLQPHWDLEHLKVGGYRGTTFPNWLGSRSYHNLIDMSLGGCKNCWIIPPLGQLPALRSLSISGLESVVTIGVEFFMGDDCASITPFSSLEYLSFQGLISWKEWRLIDMEAFPKLQSLYLSGCPKLTGNLPCQLLSLESLEIAGCPRLACSIPKCPKIQDLLITESPSVMLQEQDLPPSLCKLAISGGLMLESLSENLHIEDLRIQDCSYPFPVIHMPSSVKELIIENCASLKFILVSEAPLHSLHTINFHFCKNLKWLFDDMERLLPNLKKLTIRFCPEMEPFSLGFLPSSLKELEIMSCDKILSCQTGWHLPSWITKLTVRGDFETLNCEDLQHLTSLQELTISLCSELEKLVGDMLPASLQMLLFVFCGPLEDRIRKKDEEIWPKISHIPIINLSGELIS